MSSPHLLNTSDNFSSHVSLKKRLQDQFINKFFATEDEVNHLGEINPLERVEEDSPWLLINKWQEMLGCLLILHERNELESFRLQLVERMRHLKASFLWFEFQLVPIYQALCSHLLGLMFEEPVISQYANGSVSLEPSGRWSWGRAPHSCFHATLGTLWALYGQLSGRSEYIKAAERLADWQLNTLDGNYLPFVGLFAREREISEYELSIDNFLLFKSVSIFANRADMAAIADKQSEHIAAMSTASSSLCSLWLHACDSWLDQYTGPVASQLPELPILFKDEDLMLAGYRTAEQCVVSTLSGGGSGIGCIRFEDVNVVSFGPQHLPLGECEGFGIETHLQQLSRSAILLSETEKKFSIQGTTRLVPRVKRSLSKAVFRNGEHSGFWLDVKQSFTIDQLHVETVFHSLFDMNTLAFVFFVKASSCHVEGWNMVKLRSFERYQGEIRSVNLGGNRGSMTIEAQYKLGEMQVIPLGGGDNFWGADFLVAYFLVSDQHHYSWKVKRLKPNLRP